MLYFNQFISKGWWKMLEVRLLGNFDIKRGKKTVSIPSRSAQSLFAFLILNAGTAYRREKLAGQLWPDSTEESARDYLRHALWRIRRALQAASAGSYLQSDDLTIAFNRSPDYWLDAAALREAKEMGPIDQLAEALSGYAGELLPGFYDEWAVLEREHLQAVYERKVGCLLDLLNQAGRWQDVREWAEKWIAFGQRPEPAYQALMSAHGANGDMSKVAATYERCVKSLREFGVEPSEHTKALYDNIKSGRHSTAVARALTPVPPRPVSASNIPVLLTSFIGREGDLKKIAKLLSASRFLTLTGPGGVGKTRLAIETARKLAKKLKDGVVWVSLVGVADSKLIPQEIGQSLQVRELPSESLVQTLIAHLKPRELLLVLDNCEHLVQGCAQISEQLLAACPGLRILATSTEALGLFNEMIWQVPSLSLPDAQRPVSIKELRDIESIRLFEERAQKVKAGFAVDERNADWVVQICQRLDGIPLAIELAAARTRVLSVEEIASRLDDRFSLLTAGSRTAIPRHQTLRATVDWSYGLLSERERVVFRRLAVFEAGWTLEAAESVIAHDALGRAEVLDHLSRLVDKSLVIVEDREGTTRYRMLQTIHEYARVRLSDANELDRMCNMHFEYFLALAESAEPEFERLSDPGWVVRAETELGNFRAALTWGARRKPIGVLKMISALALFWIVRGHETEGRRYSLDALHQSSELQMDQMETSLEGTVTRAKGLQALARMMYSQGDNSHAVAYSEEAAHLARELGDKSLLADVLGWELLGRIVLGDVVGAEELAQEDLTAANATGSKWLIGLAQAMLGQVLALTRIDFEAGRKYAEQGISLLREGGNMWAAAMTMLSLGMTAKLLGRYGDARLQLLESLPLFRNMGDRHRTNIIYSELAHIERLEGNIQKAEMMYQKTIVEWQAIGHRGAVANQLECFAFIAKARGENDRAVRLLGAAQCLRENASMPMSSTEQVEYQRARDELRNSTDEWVLAEAWADGRAMSMKQAVDLALRVDG
jgi:non-specific serine/threonine protein kinase